MQVRKKDIDILGTTFILKVILFRNDANTRTLTIKFKEKYKKKGLRFFYFNNNKRSVFENPIGHRAPIKGYNQAKLEVIKYLTTNPVK